MHLGAAAADHARTKADLERAERHGDRILINGDLFDGIFPGDRRYTSSVVHPRLRGRDDPVNEVLAMAEELLRPHAGRIDLIGCGNHETSYQKQGNFDLIAETVRRLRSHTNNRIEHGGYTGMLPLVIRTPGRRNRTFLVFYHHGAGSGGSVLAAVRSLNSKSWAQADLVWEGHRHVRCSFVEHQIRWPADRTRPRVREVYRVATGSYLPGYNVQTPASIMKRGRRGTYPSDNGMAPGGLGATRVVLRAGETGLEVSVIQ